MPKQYGWRFRAVTPLLLLLLGGLTFSSGCGEKLPEVVPARGIVTINGKPVGTASVMFIPQVDAGATSIATATTDAEGRFEMKCDDKPGASAAPTIVVVTEGDIPKELQSETKQRELGVYLRGLTNRPIPAQYGSPATSPLQFEVTADKAEYNLELKR